LKRIALGLIFGAVCIAMPCTVGGGRSTCDTPDGTDPSLSVIGVDFQTGNGILAKSVSGAESGGLGWGFAYASALPATEWQYATLPKGSPDRKSVV